MTTIYVLIGEHGEYEQFTRTLYGVFSSEAGALDAIPRLEELGKKQLALYEDREKRRAEYLTRFQPYKVWPPGSCFTLGYLQYTDEQHKEADEACGPAPKLVGGDEEYVVECFNLDAIEA